MAPSVMTPGTELNTTKLPKLLIAGITYIHKNYASLKRVLMIRGLRKVFSGDKELDGSEIMYGIKYSCPLNELQSFHCTQSLPVDVMHDIFEGSILMSII